MPIRVLLGDVLEARGLKQTELQSRTGLSYSAINELVHNKTTRLTFATLEALCDALDCDVNDLLQYVPRRKSR